MGEFQAGKWIVVLSIYFFGFFIIMFGVVNASIEYDLDANDISVRDPGFFNLGTDPTQAKGECTGLPSLFCGGVETENLCESFDGCFFFNSTGCTGTINHRCSDFTENITQCRASGCTFTNFTSQEGSSTIDSSTSGFSFDAVKQTIGFMSGFDANIGSPSEYNFIFAFILFWLPFFALLWSVYMALPFLH